MEYKVEKLPDSSSKKRLNQIQERINQESAKGWKLHSMTNQTTLGFSESVLAVFYKTEADD